MLPSRLLTLLHRNARLRAFIERERLGSRPSALRLVRMKALLLETQRQITRFAGSRLGRGSNTMAYARAAPPRQRVMS